MLMASMVLEKRYLQKTDKDDVSINVLYAVSKHAKCIDTPSTHFNTEA